MTSIILWNESPVRWACSWSTSSQVYSTCEFVLNPVPDPYTHSKQVTVYFLHRFWKDNLTCSQAFHTLAACGIHCLFLCWVWLPWLLCWQAIAYYTLMYVYYSFKETGILSRKNHQGSSTLTLSRNLKSWWSCTHPSKLIWIHLVPHIDELWFVNMIYFSFTAFLGNWKWD